MSENLDPAQSELRNKRARDADRDQVMGLLDGALADGQLDGFEHRERVARALQSGTLGELGATVADLQVATPTFLVPAPKPPAPVPTEESALASEPEPDDAEGESPLPDPPDVSKVIASVIAGIAFLIVGAVIVSSFSSSDEPRRTSPWGGGALVTMCDGDGKNCKDGNGRSVPDLPRDKPPIDGVALVGNPMASTNVRKAYESMVSALAPTSVISLTVTKWSADAVVIRPDDPSQTQKWTLSGGAWKYSAYDRGKIDVPNFAPTTMNVDRITAAIADAPGIARTAREPTSVEFTPTAVTIQYTGPNDSSPTLILTPDGTVVA